VRIAIMLRTLDEHEGISVYTRNLVRALLEQEAAMFSWERCAGTTLAVLEDAVAGRVRHAGAGQLPR